MSVGRTILVVVMAAAAVVFFVAGVVICATTGELADGLITVCSSLTIAANTFIVYITRPERAS